MVKLISGEISRRFGIGGTRSGRGFAVQFDRKNSEDRTRKQLETDAVVIQGASIDAVVKTTVEVKLKIRAYINAHFKGSRFQSNDNRKVANASAQDTFYNDIAAKGQYTGLVYSKFGKRDGASGFLDFLLLHVRGGTLTARDGGWMRIDAKGKGSLGLIAQTGFFNLSNSNVFFSNSADGKKLFLLRRYKKGGLSPKMSGKTELLATLIKKIVFPARLTGIDEIARSRGDLFTKHFNDAFNRRTGTT